MDLITLRDDLSDKLLAEIGVNKPPIHITADPAFTLNIEGLEGNKDLLCEAGITDGTPYAVVAIREW